MHVLFNHSDAPFGARTQTVVKKKNVFVGTHKHTSHRISKIIGRTRALEAKENLIKMFVVDVGCCFPSCIKTSINLMLRCIKSARTQEIYKIVINRSFYDFLSCEIKFSNDLIPIEMRIYRNKIKLSSSTTIHFDVKNIVFN